jgi:hypothetical protein
MKTLQWLAMAALTGAGFGATMESGVVIAVQVKGTVEVIHGKDTSPTPVANNDALSAGDTIETKAASSCVLVLPNGSTVAVRERTRLAIAMAMQERYTDAELVAANNSKREPSKSSTSLDLLIGEIVVQAKKLLSGSDLSVKTTAGTAKVKGTEFEVAYADDAQGDGDLRVGTASGHAVFAQPDGLERDVPAGKQLGVRARRERNGSVRLERMQTANLPTERKKLIQSDAQRAARESEGGLRRMKAVHEERRKQPQRQQVTPIEREQRGRVIDTPSEKTTPPRANSVPARKPTEKPAAKPDPKPKPKPRPGGG